MAVLKDYIDRVSFEDVWAILSPEESAVTEYREAYENIFRDLARAVPQENTAKMTIRFVEEEPMWDFFFGEDEPVSIHAPFVLRTASTS